MTQREALSILIYAAAQSAAGVGQGFRSLPSAAEKARLVEAIKKLWPKAYNFPCTDSQLRNMGL